MEVESDVIMKAGVQLLLFQDLTTAGSTEEERDVNMKGDVRMLQLKGTIIV